MRTKIQKWINSILSQYFFEKKKPTKQTKTKQNKAKNPGCTAYDFYETF